MRTSFRNRGSAQELPNTSITISPYISVSSCLILEAILKDVILFQEM